MYKIFFDFSKTCQITINFLDTYEKLTKNFYLLQISTCRYIYYVLKINCSSIMIYLKHILLFYIVKRFHSLSLSLSRNKIRIHFIKIKIVESMQIYIYDYTSYVKLYFTMITSNGSKVTQNFQ